MQSKDNGKIKSIYKLRESMTVNVYLINAFNIMRRWESILKKVFQCNRKKMDFYLKLDKPTKYLLNQKRKQ